MFSKIHCGDNVNEVWKACKSGADKRHKTLQRNPKQMSNSGNEVRGSVKMIQ